MHDAQLAYYAKVIEKKQSIEGLYDHDVENKRRDVDDDEEDYPFFLPLEPKSGISQRSDYLNRIISLRQDSAESLEIPSVERNQSPGVEQRHGRK